MKCSGHFHGGGRGPGVGGWIEQRRGARDPAATVAARCEDASISERDRGHPAPAGVPELSYPPVANTLPTSSRVA